MMLFVRYECGHLLPSNKTAVYPTLAMDSLSVINDVPSEVPELEETSINLQEIHTRVCVCMHIYAPNGKTYHTRRIKMQFPYVWQVINSTSARS